MIGAMSKPAIYPEALHGTVVPAVRVVVDEGCHVLASMADADLFDRKCIAEVSNGKSLPGVRMITLWDASHMSYPSLEMAQSGRFDKGAFLISAALTGNTVERAIITSRMNSSEQGPVTTPNMEMPAELFSYRQAFHSTQLLEDHARRALEAGIDLTVPLPQPVADEIFRQMVFGAVEL